MQMLASLCVMRIWCVPIVWDGEGQGRAEYRTGIDVSGSLVGLE